MLKKSVILNALTIIFTSISVCIAMEGNTPERVWKEGISEDDKTTVCAARHLLHPFIRVTPEVYAEQNEVRKMVLGDGHIFDPLTVEPVEYRPGGGNDLRESFLGNCDYHQHKGFYTVSAEVTDSFGSDWVGNLQDPTHQESLVRKEFWDLIWDESGHVAVFEAPGLLEQVPTWLKPGGIYIVSIPSMVGRAEAENPSLARQIVDLYAKTGPDCSQELIEFVIPRLIDLGFSKVEVKPLPLLKALKDICGEIPLEQYAQTLEGDNIPQFLAHLYQTALSYVDEFAKIDPVFGEANLGKVCILATR